MKALWLGSDGMQLCCYGYSLKWNTLYLNKANNTTDNSLCNTSLSLNFPLRKSIFKSLPLFHFQTQVVFYYKREVSFRVFSLLNAISGSF